MKSSFLLGALGYPALELLYRRRTHYSMMIAGGMSAVLISKLHKWRGTFLAKVCLCSLGITGIEYLCGRIWNRRYQIWDYRKMPINFQGQVCLPFTALWALLSAGVMALLNMKDRLAGAD